VSSEFEQIAGLWQDGVQRLQALEPPQRRRAEQLVELLVHELRHRLGGVFTSDELARYYLKTGTDWCFQLVVRAAPNEPELWDMSTVAAAAFARYLRRASDQGGGVRHIDED
jgi:hypothetical protein